MSEIFIKHNPYKLKTEIKIDGKVPNNNKLKVLTKERLQDRLDELAKELIKEINEENFKIKFHGRKVDFIDLKKVFDKFSKLKNLDITYDHIPAKETKNKTDKLKKLVKSFKNAPIDELKDDRIIDGFKNAINSDFEVAVIATMSSGKSTLINSFLETDLMPSKQQACTSKTVRIKNIDNYDGFSVECFNKKNFFLIIFI